jgi:multicomponent Na+:H+ antiporter subunit E
MSYIVVAGASALMYLLVTANFSIRNLIFSLLIGGIVAAIFRPDQRLFTPRQMPSALWALFRYSLILIVDLLKSGIQVARIVLDPNLPIKPGIISISADCDTELANALSAHAITLTPGEIVIEMDECGTMFTHVLNVDGADEYAAQAQSLRRDLLRKIFP